MLSTRLLHRSPLTERHVYNRPGARTRKRGPEGDTRYLPGLAVSHRSAGVRRVDVMMAGAQCSAWSRRSEADSVRQTRYRLIDRQDSVTLELDGNACLTGREAFYPFGGTALRLTGSQCETADTSADTTPRYSGQPCDASSLYFYGFRHYAPWLGRWASPDPAGTVDGLNLFAMVRNNPATLRDAQGLSAWDDEPLDDKIRLLEEQREAVQIYRQRMQGTNLHLITMTGSVLSRLGKRTMPGLIRTENALRQMAVREFDIGAFIRLLATPCPAGANERYQALVMADDHTTAADVRVRDGAMSVILIDSYFPHITNVLPLRVLTPGNYDGTPPSLGMVATEMQADSVSCAIFSLSTATKMAQHPDLLDTLHDATREARPSAGLWARLISRQPWTIGYGQFDKTVLPPAFYKHAQRRNVVRDIEAVHGAQAVNKKQQTLSERHMAHRPIEGDMLGLSTSIMEKQEYYLNRAIAWYEGQRIGA